MRRVPIVLGSMLGIVLIAGCGSEQGGQPEVTLKLGGKFCEFYPDPIQEALRRVEGVKSVDLASKKGHAVITGDPGTMKATDLRNAVNGVKGEGWHCEAEIVN